MLGALQLLVLTAAAGAAEPPRAAVVLSRLDAVTREEGLRQAEKLSASLERRGIRVRPAREAAELLRGELDPLSCKGEVACIAQASGGLEVEAVVSLELGRLGGRVAVHAKAIHVAEARTLEQLTLVFTPEDGSDPLGARTGPLAEAILTLAPPEKPPERDAPRVTELRPPPPEPPPTPPLPPESPSPTPAVYVSAGVAVALAVTAGIFAVGAQRSSATLRAAYDGEQDPPRYSLPEGRALELQAAARRDSMVAGVAGAGSLAAGGLAAALFLFE